LEDQSRASKAQVGDDLSAQQWQELRDILIVARYEDTENNMRRFPSLEEHRDWLMVEIHRTGSNVHRSRLGSLLAIKQQSKARSWHGLLERVVAHFSLVEVQEKFKVQRNCWAAQENCKRLIGEVAMLDPYRTKCRKKRPVLQSQTLKRKAEVLEGEGQEQQPQKKPHSITQFFQKERFQVRAPHRRCQSFLSVQG
jgi:hypothetical protein